MIQKYTLTFLKNLNNNNNRDWFQENKKTYEAARADFTAFVDEMIEAIRKFDDTLGPITAKNCMFRINRDIRFSKDKTPYKPHFSAFIPTGGQEKGMSNAGYYFMIKPGGKSLVGGGIHGTQSEKILSIRHNIEVNGDQLVKLFKSKAFKDNFGQVDGEKLKNVPRGFDKESEFAELLKHKDFTASYSLTDMLVQSSDLKKELLKGWKILHPMVSFMAED